MKTCKLISANGLVEFREGGGGGGNAREVNKLISKVTQSLDSKIVDHF